MPEGHLARVVSAKRADCFFALPKGRDSSGPNLPSTPLARCGADISRRDQALVHPWSQRAWAEAYDSGAYELSRGAAAEVPAGGPRSWL